MIFAFFVLTFDKERNKRCRKGLDFFKSVVLSSFTNFVSITK